MSLKAIIIMSNDEKITTGGSYIDSVEMEIGAAGVEYGTPSPERKPYFKSADFLELLSCGILLAVCIAVSKGISWVRQRPIPFQLLADGSYAQNQVNSQSYSGDETISSKLS